MARANLELVIALRRTAARLETDVSYRWSHYGMCNCGHLAQTVTSLSPREIHEAALSREGDWGRLAREYCTSTGYRLDHILDTMLELGLSRDDIQSLERLDASRVLDRLPEGERDLRHYDRHDAIRYMRAWADLLEDELGGARMAAK
jgi:hypothetical protein